MQLDCYANFKIIKKHGNVFKNWLCPNFLLLPKIWGRGAAAPLAHPTAPLPVRTPTGKGVNVVPEHGMKKMLIPIHYPASLSSIRRSIA